MDSAKDQGQYISENLNFFFHSVFPVSLIGKNFRLIIIIIMGINWLIN